MSDRSWAKTRQQGLGKRLFSLLIVGSVVVQAEAAQAIRPFITDDARVVGARSLQMESWVQLDENALQHWILPSFGPTSWLELSVGGVHGAAKPDDAYSTSGPLLQVKALAYEGVGLVPSGALVTGLYLAEGSGTLKLSSPSWFASAVLTNAIGSRALVHANIGGAVAGGSVGDTRMILTLGLAGQFGLTSRVVVLGEVVRGDAFSGALDGAVHAGLRYVFNDHFQLDATVGTGVWGVDRRPTWATIGVRLASEPLW